MSAVPGALENPFVTGKISRGNITHPGYEHVQMEVMVQTMQPVKVFSFTWHPYAVDPKIDDSKEPSTLVEFKLEKTATGTLLTLAESGFDYTSPGRRLEAFRKNDGGWTQQLKNYRGVCHAKALARRPPSCESKPPSWRP
jgi:hypothetical protein